MIVCLAGKNDLAVGCLRYLLSSQAVRSEHIVAIHNSTGDGVGPCQESYRHFCARHQITSVELRNIAPRPDLVFISLQFDRLLATEDFASVALFNIHTSLLPRYKGFHTAALPILNGDSYSGTTLHVIDHGIDTGAIIDQQSFAITADDSARDVYTRCVATGIELFAKNIRALLTGAFRATPQSAGGSSYHSRSAVSYEHVDLRKTATDIRTQLRALTFPEYQMPLVAGSRICRCEVLPERSTVPSGTVIGETSSSIRIATIDFDLLLHKVLNDHSGGG